MSVTEPDGLDDAVAQEWRTALLLAAQVAEWVARRAEQRAHTDEQAAVAEAGQTGDRYTGERELARAEVSVADNPAWWDQADPAAVTRVYATAQAWTNTDREFADGAQRVQTEIRDRYGPAVEAQLNEAVAAGLAGPSDELTEDQAQAWRRAGETELASILAGQARQDTTTATPNATDSTTHTEITRGVNAGWDTPQRRHAFAASISSYPDAQAVEARVRLDRSRSHPASSIVTATRQRKSIMQHPATQTRANPSQINLPGMHA